MKKKLVAFAVTAAMLVTSAVPAFALDKWGETPAVSGTEGNVVMVDTNGITTYEVAGEVSQTSPKTFETVIDLNYNIGSGNQLAYFLNYKDADNKDGQLYVGVKKVSDGTYIVDLGGNQIKGLNGIVTLQWTVTNSSVQIKAIEHAVSEEPVKVTADKDYVEFVVAPHIASITSLKAATSANKIAMYKERPEVLVDVTVSKPNPDDDAKVEGDEWITVDQPALGDQLWVTALNFDKGVNASMTGKETAFKANYADIARYVDLNKIEWYSDETKVGQGLTYTVKDTDRGNVITVKVPVKTTTGLFKTVTWGEGNDPIAIFDRYAGANRYETAMAVADAMKANGSWNRSNVVVASGEAYADALSATALADEKDCPILLVNSGTEEAVAEYIKANLKNYNSTVYFIGGKDAVSDNFYQMFYKYNRVRLGGADRYATNLAILKALANPAKNILVASGTNYPDALSASATGNPVLLVGETLTADQWAFTKSIKADKHQYTVVGGNAVISNTVLNQISVYDADNVVDRLYGADRFETNEKVINKYFAKAGSDKTKYDYSQIEAIVVASGNGFADALAGAAYAANFGAFADNDCPVVLVNDNNYDRAANIVRSNILLKVVGGEMSVSNELVQKIA